VLVKIAPSILAADFGRLAEQVQEAEAAGADWIHVDVMDGHFVGNITIGPLVTDAVRRATALPLDVHLMIERPERYLEAFRDAGADVLTVHQETCPHLYHTIEQIRGLGVRAGAAVKPSTPVDTLADVAAHLDLLLVMTVNPGFGGQAYIPSGAKVAQARALLDGAGREDAHVEVDGGIDSITAPEAVRAGADVLVAGSSVFRHVEGVQVAIEALRSSVDA
jgi:ribulose-phosphate 3-epimerase